MTETVLLVDYENVQEVDLSRIDPSVEVHIFVGASQTRVSTALFKQALERGGKTKVEQIDGTASNALDFHIAFYLGEYFAARAKARYRILSADRGFDPLVRHLEGRGCDCRRITSPTQLEAHAPTAHEDKYRQVVTWIGKMEKNARPRKRKTLATHIDAYYQKKLPVEEIELLIDRLINDNRVTDSGTAVTYHF